MCQTHSSHFAGFLDQNTDQMRTVATGSNAGSDGSNQYSITAANQGFDINSRFRSAGLGQFPPSGNNPNTLYIADVVLNQMPATDIMTKAQNDSVTFAFLGNNGQ